MRCEGDNVTTTEQKTKQQRNAVQPVTPQRRCRGRCQVTEASPSPIGPWCDVTRGSQTLGPSPHPVVPD